MIIPTVVTPTHNVSCSIPTPIDNVSPIVQRQISGAHIVPCCLATSVWPFVPDRQSIVIEEHQCLEPALLQCYVSDALICCVPV